jgi:peptidoglycan/xylan/chitin deacetylase (PgdA/CDA1 family)
MTRRRALALATAAGVGAAAAPALLSVGPLRRVLTPRFVPAELSGLSSRHHVALTFDDGPDPTSTPSFLGLLDELDVRATFFVLGRHVGDLGLLREMAWRGHEIGVHGWDHRPAAVQRPFPLRDGIARTRDLVADATGTAVTWYRPPYGLLTPASWWAADRSGLRVVLWSAWGRDWEPWATPASVTSVVQAQLRPGGTVLLHDSDRVSARGSWRTTLVATRRLVRLWRRDGLDVGPLASHWTEPVAPAA